MILSTRKGFIFVIFLYVFVLNAEDSIKIADHWMT